MVWNPEAQRKVFEMYDRGEPERTIVAEVRRRFRCDDKTARRCLAGVALLQKNLDARPADQEQQERFERLGGTEHYLRELERAYRSYQGFREGDGRDLKATARKLAMALARLKLEALVLPKLDRADLTAARDLLRVGWDSEKQRHVARLQIEDDPYYELLLDASPGLRELLGQCNESATTYYHLANEKDWRPERWTLGQQQELVQAEKVFERSRADARGAVLAWLRQDHSGGRQQPWP